MIPDIVSLRLLGLIKNIYMFPGTCTWKFSPDPREKDDDKGKLLTSLSSIVS